MVEKVEVTGIVLSSMPIGEYDKRVVILTKEFGKMSAFARGARKPNSPYLAGSQPMAFGKFSLYPGRNAYSINNIQISDYFSNDLTDPDKMYMGMYFLELADYFAKEGLEAGEMLNLIYMAMKTLVKSEIPLTLIRRVYEFKMLVINGEYPDVFACGKCGSKENLDYFDLAHDCLVCENCHETLPEDKKLKTSTVYALQYIVTSSMNKLFAFNVKEDILKQLDDVIGAYVEKRVDKHFNSLEFL